MISMITDIGRDFDRGTNIRPWQGRPRSRAILLPSLYLSASFSLCHSSSLSHTCLAAINCRVRQRRIVLRRVVGRSTQPSPSPRHSFMNDEARRNFSRRYNLPRNRRRADKERYSRFRVYLSGMPSKERVYVRA